MNGVAIVGIILLVALYIFRNKDRLGSGKGKLAYSKKDKEIIAASAMRIGDVINESLKMAVDSGNPETIISRLGVAKDRLAELESIAERYPFIDLENLSEFKRDIANFEVKIRPLVSSYPVDAVSQVKSLKKQGKNCEAIELLSKCIDSMEANVTELGGVAPWYYEQLAIIYRKEKRHNDELEILERYSM